MSRFNKNIFHTEGALSHNYVPEKERERTVPVAKTRWHPKPDQIQILEAIVNSGMVNPPREEIKRIRGQLEEFGHVEDVNVFYWFQNRKARVKRKRQLQNAEESESRAAKCARPLSSSSSSLTSTTSTSTSVQSQPVTIVNQAPSSSAGQVISSFAGHHCNQQVNQKMSTTQYSNIQPIGAGGATESRGISNEGT